MSELDLGDLNEGQMSVARQMQLEEAGCFSCSDDDIGCIDELQMKVNLTDDRPVQKNYTAIPKPLYPAEVKQYVEDVLNRQWIRKSKPTYSSPVVCVRKKHGSLRLCVDYRELNNRTVADRQNLGENKWFSLLGQGKGTTRVLSTWTASTKQQSSHHGGFMNGCGFHSDLKMYPPSSRDLWKTALRGYGTISVLHTLMM